MVRSIQVSIDQVWVRSNWEHWLKKEKNYDEFVFFGNGDGDGDGDGDVYGEGDDDVDGEGDGAGSDFVNLEGDVDGVSYLEIGVPLARNNGPVQLQKVTIAVIMIVDNIDQRHNLANKFEYIDPW